MFRTVPFLGYKSLYSGVFVRVGLQSPMIFSVFQSEQRIPPVIIGPTTVSGPGALVRLGSLSPSTETARHMDEIQQVSKEGHSGEENNLLTTPTTAPPTSPLFSQRPLIIPHRNLRPQHDPLPRSQLHNRTIPHHHPRRPEHIRRRLPPSMPLKLVPSSHHRPAPRPAALRHFPARNACLCNLIAKRPEYRGIVTVSVPAVAGHGFRDERLDVGCVCFEGETRRVEGGGGGGGDAPPCARSLVCQAAVAHGDVLVDEPDDGGPGNSVVGGIAVLGLRSGC